MKAAQGYITPASHCLPDSTCSPGLVLVCTGPPREASGAMRHTAPEVRLLFLQKAVLDFSTFPCLRRREEREGVRKRRKRGREADKLQASTLEQPYSTGLIMEFKGVCVLLGVLLLVNCSLQQSPTRKKPVKKGR